jgi:hypothetical protein
MESSSLKSRESGRRLEELTHAELVELCRDLIVYQARLNGQLAAYQESARGIGQLTQHQDSARNAALGEGWSKQKKEKK